MKKNSFFTAIGLITAVWFSACTNDELVDDNTLPEGKYPLEIASVTMNVESSSKPWGANAPQTRVTESDTDGKSSVWEWNGTEKIGVQIAGSKGTAGTYVLKTDANSNHVLEAEKYCYWESKDANQTINAWYPTNGTVHLADQSSKLAYVLKGTGTGDFNNSVSLTFAHQLAKVRVVLSGTQAGLAQNVEVYGCTTCTNNEGAPTAGSTQGWIKMKRATYADGIECWEANVVPGTITISNFIRLNGMTVVSNLSGIPETLDAAKMYTIDLTVGDNQIFGGETITKPGEYICHRKHYFRQ